MTTIADIIGTEAEDEFLNFDLTEIQETLSNLRNTDTIDLAHAEKLAQQCLRCADILAEYLGKLIKTTGYLESKVSSTKNKIALEYESPGGKTTADQRKAASESAPEVDELQIRLAKAKGSKSLVEKKYDILLKSHHSYKDVAAGLRKTILGYGNGT